MGPNLRISQKSGYTIKLFLKVDVSKSNHYNKFSDDFSALSEYHHVCN